MLNFFFQGSEESVKEVFPTSEEPSEEAELLVSIPVQWENGQLLCQHDSKGEEVYDVVYV